MSINVHGIDASVHQGNVDWPRIKLSGKAKFVILRAGYGRYDKQVDKKWERNYAECKRLGIPVGAYWYSYAVSEDEARQEMQCFLRALAGKQLEYPVYFDQEYEPAIKALSKAKRTAIVKAALETLEDAGYYAGLYCSRDWLNNWLDFAQLSAYDVWIADYTSAEPSPAKLPYGMRQVDSKNSFGVPGFGGSLDCDVAYKDYPGIIKGAGLNGWKKTETNKPAADKPSGCTLTIGPVSAGDRATLRSKCQGLQLDAMGLYKETESDGLYTLTVGPITSGDVATLKALCEQLDLVSRGLYREV